LYISLKAESVPAGTESSGCRLVPGGRLALRDTSPVSRISCALAVSSPSLQAALTSAPKMSESPIRRSSP
jgi:hypothetical protein